MNFMIKFEEEIQENPDDLLQFHLYLNISLHMDVIKYLFSHTDSSVWNIQFLY